MNFLTQMSSKDTVVAALVGLGFLGLWRWQMGHNFDALYTKPGVTK